MTEECERTKWNGQDALILAIVALGLSLLFFRKMIFTDLILPRGDVFSYFYPYWDYRNTALRSGYLPQWNPFLFMGVPFLANSQAGVLYPPNWVTIPFDAPTAVKIALVSHAVFGFTGMTWLARFRYKVSLPGSILAGLVYMLGGYITAQAEHINQYQGLAWLPWLYILWWLALEGRRGYLLMLGIAFGMVLLAGHMQTVFISGVGLSVSALWAGWVRWHRDPEMTFKNWETILFPLAVTGLASLLGVGFAASQLVPTLELTGLSNRSGGLTALEAVSFSLRPGVIGVAFLPGYQRPWVFTEYVAYIGVAGGILAVIGAWAGRSKSSTLSLIIVTTTGIFLALGAYNPIYWLLVRFVPGFDLFRAPARWLGLWAFGAALLTGIGLDAVISNDHRWFRSVRESWSLIPPAILIGLALLAPTLSADVPGANVPTWHEIGLWLGAALSTALLIGNRQISAPVRTGLLMGLVSMELFVASFSLPINDLSPPQLWSTQRPAVSTIKTMSAGLKPPPRLLSMSDTRFDPGDLLEIETIYGPYLDESGLFNYVVAIKEQEVIAPNLPLHWEIHSMDGFDGGILPTRDYISFTSAFLPNEIEASDGRLREFLVDIPDPAYLKLANVAWVITDRVNDLWIDGIYYDNQFVYELDDNLLDAVARTEFPATEVRLIAEFRTGTFESGDTAGFVRTFSADSRDSLEYPVVVWETFEKSDSLSQAVLLASLPDRIRISRLSIRASGNVPLDVQGVTLVDTSTGTFMPTTLNSESDFQLIYAADVKVYQLNHALPRAFILCNTTYDPRSAIPGEDVETCPDAEVVIDSYTPEQVLLRSSSSHEGWLILLDAYYPGWEVFVDGQTLQIHKVFGIFRGVWLEAGEHEIQFVYRSRSFQIGVVVSLITLVVSIGGTWMLKRST